MFGVHAQVSFHSLTKLSLKGFLLPLVPPGVLHLVPPVEVAFSKYLQFPLVPPAKVAIISFGSPSHACTCIVILCANGYIMISSKKMTSRFLVQTITMRFLLQTVTMWFFCAQECNAIHARMPSMHAIALRFLVQTITMQFLIQTITMRFLPHNITMPSMNACHPNMQLHCDSLNKRLHCDSL